MEVSTILDNDPKGVRNDLLTCKVGIMYTDVELSAALERPVVNLCVIFVAKMNPGQCQLGGNERMYKRLEQFL